MDSRLRALLIWIAVFTITAAVFYGIDHAVMAGQGLPLNLNLTPQQ